MKIYETMRQVQPQFFIESGDNVYSDGSIANSQPAENGLIWNNIVTPEVAKVAETLNEFRGRYKYNLLDDNVRRFNTEVPQIWQWGDHEAVNNWSSVKDLSQDNRYTLKDVPTLIAHATKAFLEYAPLRPNGADEPERIYRKLSYGRLLDVFVLDMRSYHDSNTNNLQTVESFETDFLGPDQLNWLKQELKKSNATWKVISADMPIGLNVGDGKDANGDNGPAAGRELEMPRLLRFIKREGIKNLFWLTADVHYTAAHFFRSGQSRDQGFFAILEVCRRPPERRIIWPEYHRRHLRFRSASDILQSSTGRASQPVSLHRLAILR